MNNLRESDIEGYIVVGKQNATIPHSALIEIPKSIEIVRIDLRVHKGRPLLFGFQPWFEVLRDRTTKRIHHLVFFSYHTQAFFYETNAWDTRVYHDLVWNAACGFAGIPVLRPMYFLRQASFKKKVPNPHKRFCLLKRAIKLRWLEKQNEKDIPESAIAYAFHPILKKHSSLQLLPDRNGSYVGAMIRFFIERAWIKLRTKAWRETPEATKMFDTAITNLLNPEMIAKRIATNQAFRKSEIRKNSGRCQNSLEGLKKRPWSS